MYPSRASTAFTLSPRHYSIANLVAFKLLWVCLVVFQAQGVWPGIMLLLFMLLTCPTPVPTLKAALTVAGIGITLDNLLIWGGFFSFTAFDGYFIPAWLILLWCGFGLALPHGLSFLFRLPLYLQVLAGAGASLSYLAGRQLEAVTYPYPTLNTQFLLALIWAIALPLFISLPRPGVTRAQS